jgi:hypothetical protein
MIRMFQNLALKLAFFSCWFISFSLINFELQNWGLQVGWIACFLFCFIYLRNVFTKTYVYKNPLFISTIHIFITIFVFSFLAWITYFAGFITPPTDGHLNRSMGHVGYIFFYFFVYICIYHALATQPNKYWSRFDWLFIKPFIFIAIWGIYQLLSTYDLVEYLTVFNNNLSTGFTYERFKDHHRVSSIFPEPSEYSYYLALMGPIVWAHFKNKIPLEQGLISRYFLLLLWLSQAVFVKSLSFFLAIPVLIYLCLRYINKYSLSKTVIYYSFFGIFIFILLSLNMADRLSSTAGGDDGSVLVRYMSFFETLEYFSASPVIGFGYGSVRGTDAFSFFLASFGFLGSTLIIYLGYKFTSGLKNNSDPIFFCAVCCLLYASILSNNPLDHIFLWVILAFMSVSQHKLNTLTSNTQNTQVLRPHKFR